MCAPCGSAAECQHQLRCCCRCWSIEVKRQHAQLLHVVCLYLALQPDHQEHGIVGCHETCSAGGFRRFHVDLSATWCHLTLHPLALWGWHRWPVHHVTHNHSNTVAPFLSPLLLAWTGAAAAGTQPPGCRRPATVPADAPQRLSALGPVHTPASHFVAESFSLLSITTCQNGIESRTRLLDCTEVAICCVAAHVFELSW